MPLVPCWLQKPPHGPDFMPALRKWLLPKRNRTDTLQKLRSWRHLPHPGARSTYSVRSRHNGEGRLEHVFSLPDRVFFNGGI